ncbi:MAG: hypothetical protein JNM93_00810 [Bacteriovoracaceae bacterium]|nr:hypothetical protein [Bacteriovoracaceae bacterium]
MKTVIVFFALVVGGYLTLNFNSKEKKLTDVQQQEIIDKLLSQVSDRWRMGDIENYYSANKFNCPQISNKQKIDPAYFQCNPEYLECFLNGQTGQSKSKMELTQKIQLRFKADVPEKNHLPYSFYYLELKLNGSDRIYPIALEASCHQVYLPEKNYTYFGRATIRNKNVTTKWNNIGRQIYIDKYLVNNFQVNEWRSFKNEAPKFSNENHQPSYDLKLKERKEYCEFRGKKLLTPEYFQAAAVMPDDDNSQAAMLKLNPYPWSRFKDDVLHTQEELTKDEYQKLCGLNYTRECHKIIPFNAYYGGYLTWTGMNLSLGGPLEVFDSEHDNLKLSSFYFERTSALHRLNAFGRWEGEEFGVNDITWGNNYEVPPAEETQVKIGFRCYEIKSY